MVNKDPSNYDRAPKLPSPTQVRRARKAAGQPPPTTYGSGREEKVMTPGFTLIIGKIKRFYTEQLAPRGMSPASQAEKVFLEATELDADPDNWDEAADVFIALVNWVFVKGGDIDMFLDAVNRKADKNLGRQWTLTPDGEVRHV